MFQTPSSLPYSAPSSSRVLKNHLQGGCRVQCGHVWHKWEIPSCHSQALQVLQHLMLFISKPSSSAPETRGVNGNSLKWLKPFLCKQRSCCGNHSSTPKPSAQASEEACFAPGRNVGRSLSNKCSPSHANKSGFVFSCNQPSVQNSWLAPSSGLRGCCKEEGQLWKLLIVFLAIGVSASGTSMQAAGCLTALHVFFQSPASSLSVLWQPAAGQRIRALPSGLDLARHVGYPEFVPSTSSWSLQHLPQSQDVYPCSPPMCPAPDDARNPPALPKGCWDLTEFPKLSYPYLQQT